MSGSMKRLVCFVFFSDKDTKLEKNKVTKMTHQK